MDVSAWDLGNAIRSARLKKKYTQDQLSELLEITTVHLQHIERGARRPSVPVLFHMMRLLDFSVDELVFPERKKGSVLYTDGLTEAEIHALTQLVDAMKE